MAKKVIRKVGVLGAGVMGSGIAAHCANAGIPVLLLDIVPKDVAVDAKRSERDKFATSALAATLKQKPAAFFHPSVAKLVSVGNLTDDLERLKDCDLVIEAIVERLDIKRALFEKLEKVVGEGAIVASNTSGLRIHDMMEGRSEGFRKRFLVMHFFNPVRYMKLLELVTGPDTDPSTLAAIAGFGKEVLGKGIVVGKDTPNFVGNRIGIHSMMTTIHEMTKAGFSPEEVDAITGAPMGHPKSASFRTADMVGLDTFVHVADNCHKSLPDDEDRAVFEVPAFVRGMVERKLLGDKTKAGFYRKGKGGDIETLDLTTLAYRPKGGDEAILKAAKSAGKLEDPRARLKKLVATEGKVGAFAWTVLSRSLAYAARRIGEITDDVAAIDAAMRWGYNWELGPFQTWDALGFAETTDRMKKDGIALPASVEKMRASGAAGFYRADGAVYDLAKGDYVTTAADARDKTVTETRVGKAAVLKNGGAEAWDLGDGVLGLTFTTKANSIDGDVIEMVGQAVARAEQDFRALVIANEGEHFCVGANLFAVVMAAQQGQWDELRKMVSSLQRGMQQMKYARVPVVAAPFGVAVGGGLEICLASHAVQAAAETYAGLVEVGVGIIPGGAGNLNLLSRAFESIPEGTVVDSYAIVTNVFKSIALAKVATSAVEAKQFGYFRVRDGVSFDRARQVHEAKRLAIGLSESGHHPPSPRTFSLPGESGIATLGMMVDTLVAGGQASEHDAKIARKLAGVLCGGVGGHTRDVTEDELLELELEAFLSLCGEAKSQERMQFMLMNQKPLRN